MTMVEKMALAMMFHAPPLNELLAKELALAVLQAMREPTEAMLDAAAIHSTVLTQYMAMIDAAIAEAEPK